MKHFFSAGSDSMMFLSVRLKFLAKSRILDYAIAFLELVCLSHCVCGFDWAYIYLICVVIN